MVQNKGDASPQRRGRPRAYDPETALRSARDAFWRTGYSGASLDDISAATAMNRPSLFAAFGDKRALYRKALDEYWRMAFADMREALASTAPLSQALLRVYEGALSIYFSGEGRARGCFVMGTAVTEAFEDAEIRASLAKGFDKFDADFKVRFESARENGEISDAADTSALALLATATMHTLAVRARAGVARDELRVMARKAIGVICASEVDKQ
jgi:AcrR family transcriptional regulator